MTQGRSESLEATLAALTEAGWPEAEVYAKAGRSRTLVLDGRRLVSTVRREEGWAVRAGDNRRSFFFAASGAPRPDAPWPDADGAGIRLPSPRPVARWVAPGDLDAPLTGENDAVALLRGVGKALDSELPGARVARAVLDDGSSEAQLLSSRDVASRVRQRGSMIRVEAVRGTARHAVVVEATAREARLLNPVALARRLADRLMVAERGKTLVRDRGEILLAPAAAARLLAGLAPLWVGPGAPGHALGDRQGRLGGAALTLIDNGRLPGGLLDAPVDGEGIPTRGVRLVAEGVAQQPLLAWHETPHQPGLASGCSRRPSWRDLPTPGPTHLFLAPSPDTSAADLIAHLARGYYLLDAEATPRIDAEADRFELPVCGFAIDRGQAAGAVSGVRLVGSIRALLRGILATARDLTFVPAAGGMVGAPTVLVRGLELVGRGG